jgi:hypothetical protein
MSPSLEEIDAMLGAEDAADEALAVQMHETLRRVVIGVIYALSFAMLGADPRKAAAAGALICICLFVGLARQAVMRAGLIFVPYAMLFWMGVAPAPAGLLAWACRY